jgi:hypothetical protein
LLLDLDDVGEVAAFADLRERPGAEASIASRWRCIHPVHIASTPESSSHCALAQASASRNTAAVAADPGGIPLRASSPRLIFVISSDQAAPAAPA